MPANVDSMMYRYATQADVPWHKEGVPVAGLQTAAECIVAAGLDWDVGKFAAHFTDLDGVYHAVPDRWHTVRTDRMTALGVVGKQYTPLQNKEAFAFFDALVGEGKAIYETAGSLDGGRKIWLLAKLPGEIRVLGDDIAEKFVLLANGHDGQCDIAIGATPVRVVCQNTLTMALGGRNQWLSAPHRKGVAAAVKEMGKLLGELNACFDTAGDIAKNMAAVKFSDEQAKNYFAASYANEVREALRRGAPWKGQDELMKLVETGRGSDLPGVKGTLWSAYNAVTEYEDHGRTVRESTSRVGRNWFGQGAVTKLAAFKNAELVIAGEATFGNIVELDAVAVN